MLTMYDPYKNGRDAATATTLPCPAWPALGGLIISLPHPCSTPLVLVSRSLAVARVVLEPGLVRPAWRDSQFRRTQYRLQLALLRIAT